MPAENLEHEGLAKNPNLELAQYKFYLTLDQHKNDASVKQKLMEAICSDGKLVAPSYYFLGKSLLKWFFLFCLCRYGTILRRSLQRFKLAC
jgi:hypothetical protein